MLRSSFAFIVLIGLLALAAPSQAGLLSETVPPLAPPTVLPPLPEAHATASVCTSNMCVANVSVNLSSSFLHGIDVRDPNGGGGPSCEPIVWTGGDPEVAINPVLNLFYVNLEGCTPLLSGEVHPT